MKTIRIIYESIVHVKKVRGGQLNFHHFFDTSEISEKCHFLRLLKKKYDQSFESAKRLQKKNFRHHHPKKFPANLPPPPLPEFFFFHHAKKKFSPPPPTNFC